MNLHNTSTTRQEDEENAVPVQAKRARFGILTALTILTGALFGNTTINPAFAATKDVDVKPGTTKELRYDGRTELGATEKMLSLALTGGAFAVLSAWAYKRNREDDEEEQIRIKEEVERLEKLKAEFLDVEDFDDDSIDDEDLYKELSKRLEDSVDDLDDDSEGSGDDPDLDEGEVVAAAASTTTPTENENKTGGSDIAGGEEDGDESLDMLRRMWDASDEDPKSDEGKPASST